jgi:hypothetical protein
MKVAAVLKGKRALKRLLCQIRFSQFPCLNLCPLIEAAEMSPGDWDTKERNVCSGRHSFTAVQFIRDLAENGSSRDVTERESTEDERSALSMGRQKIITTDNEATMAVDERSPLSASPHGGKKVIYSFICFFCCCPGLISDIYFRPSLATL